VSRILLVDDEPTLLGILALNLIARGYEVETAHNAASAITDEIDRFHPDLVVLDLELPDKNGMEVLRELRARRPTLPIVILSAQTDSCIKVAALDLGAVDYITKPFGMDETLARLRSALHRPSPAPFTYIGDLTVDFDAHTITDTSNTAIHLTPTEWRILEVLLARPRSLVSARQLLTAVRRDPNNTDSSYLRIYFRQLRHKLEPVPSRPRHLITEPGLGYRFQP
jgi:two-component system KDP operon response regulator KdpE